MKVSLWRSTAAVRETIDAAERGRCQSLDGWGYGCLARAHWVVAWTFNATGLPNMGTDHHAFACDVHLAERMRRVTDEHTGTVTVTAYKEEPS